MTPVVVKVDDLRKIIVIHHEGKILIPIKKDSATDIYGDNITDIVRNGVIAQRIEWILSQAGCYRNLKSIADAIIEASNISKVLFLDEI